MSEKVYVDLDKLRTRIERQHVVEFSDVDLLFALLEDQQRQIIEARKRAEQADTERKAWTELGAKEQRRADAAEADRAALRQLIEQYTTAATYDDRATLRARMYDVALGMPIGDAILAERTRLLVVAYEVWELLDEIAEFGEIVGEDTIPALDRALSKAFGSENPLDVKERIVVALGGYEAALKARRGE